MSDSFGRGKAASMIKAIATAVFMIFGAGAALAGGSVVISSGDSGGDPFSASVSRGSTDQPIGRFKVFLSGLSGNIQSVKVGVNGARTGLSNLKLWFSTDNALGSDTLLGTIPIDPGDGVEMTFSSFSQAMANFTPYWFFVTADVAGNSTGEIRGAFGSGVALTFNFGTYGAGGFLSTADVLLPVSLSAFELD